MGKILDYTDKAKGKEKVHEIRIQMAITMDLPKEIADEAELLGIFEFDKCLFDSDTRRVTMSYATTYYKRGA